MHRFHVRAALMVAAAALALAACGSSSKPASSGTTPPTVAPTTAVPTTTAPAAKATVTSEMNATIGKNILVDSSGMTLYVWDNDKTAGTASCTGQCAAAWPPLKATGTPTYGAGLTASMFSTIAGDQLAVNGKPLYLWVNDKKAGDATGQGVNGFYVVGVDGKKIDSD